MTDIVVVTSRSSRAFNALLQPRPKLALKIAISATLVAWLVYATDREALTDALLEVDLSTALFAVVVLFALIAVQAWRWTFVARALEISLPVAPAWLICQIGAFFNQVLPSSIGGDAMRVWRLRRRGVETGPALSSVVLDRVVALVGTILIVAVGLPWLLSWMDTDALRIGIVAVVGVGATGVAVLLSADRVPLLRRLAGTGGLARVLQVPVLARRVLFKPRTAVPTLALSVIIHLGVAMSVWLLARSTSVHLTWAETAFLVPVVILFSMVPITIAGWGVREGAMVVALGTVGVGREEALAISVLFGIASAIAASPGGLVWLATGRSSSAQSSSRRADVAQSVARPRQARVTPTLHIHDACPTRQSRPDKSLLLHPHAADAPAARRWELVSPRRSRFWLHKSVERGALRGRAFMAGLRQEPGLLLVEGDTYAATAAALADAYRSVRAGGRIAVLNASDGSDARRAIEGFRFEHGVLPLRETTVGMVEIEVPPPKEPTTHFARALREKWREVPVSRDVRAFSEDLALLDDEELLKRWERHRRETSSPDVRGWYQARYRDELRGKRVLDFGCGFGVDGIFFAENGADMTFADIVLSNLEILARIAKKRGLSIQTHFIEDFFDYSFEKRFDVIMAIGSLINAPLSFTQRQLDSLLRWHAPGGTFLLLGYPRERFEQLGVRNGHEFGMLTDGERTPWCEWLDRGRVEQLFGSRYEVVFERNFGVGGNEFNWFELRRASTE